MMLKLIQIGNSKGVRLPKTVIEKYHFSEELDMVETDEGIIIKAKPEPRKGWDEQFRKAKESDKMDADFSDLSSISNEFDSSEWTW